MITRSISLCLLLILIPIITFAESEDNIQELLQKGLELANTNHPNDALQYADKVLEINSTNIDALNIKGVVLAKLGKYEEAMKYFDRVLEINPKNIVALSNKGAALVQLEKNQEALQYLDEVLKIDPKNENALNNKIIAINNLPRKSTHDSKYIVYAQIQIRNSAGQLVGYLETDDISYLDYEITDKFVNSQHVKKIVTINSKNYDLIEIIGKGKAKTSDDFVSTAKLFANDTNISVTAFSTTFAGYLLEEDDVVSALWSILKPSD